MPALPEWETAPINDVLNGAMSLLLDKMDKIRETHPMEEASFAIDQPNGVVVFMWRDGKRAQAPVQIIGVGKLEDPSNLDVLHFKWAWEDETVPFGLRAAAVRVREFGAKRGFDELSGGGVLRVHTKRAWAYLGLAAALSDTVGAFRGPIGAGKEAFLAFGPLT
jgi:hypothetical protein